MNTLIKYLLGALLFTSSVAGADLYPHQPKLQAAHNNLMSAKAHLARSQQSHPKINLNKASVDLAAAESYLQNAAKNKGSSRLAAIKAIQAAQAEIVKIQGGGSSASTAIQYVDDAVKEVADSARAGRR